MASKSHFLCLPWSFNGRGFSKTFSLFLYMQLFIYLIYISTRLSIDLKKYIDSIVEIEINLLSKSLS